MAPSRFGRLAARDPRLVHDMRRGREPRDKMVEQIETFLAKQELPR
ncbi:hypothetical protein ACG3SL_02950 [Sphingomonas sp. CJ20]